MFRRHSEEASSPTPAETVEDGQSLMYEKWTLVTLGYLGIMGLVSIEAINSINTDDIVKAVKGFAEHLNQMGETGFRISTIVAGSTFITKPIQFVWSQIEQTITGDNGFTKGIKELIKNIQKAPPLAAFLSATMNRIFQVSPYWHMLQETGQFPQEYAWFGFLVLPLFTSWVYRFYYSISHQEEEEEEEVEEEVEEEEGDKEVDKEVEEEVDKKGKEEVEGEVETNNEQKTNKERHYPPGIKGFITRMNEDPKFANEVMNRIIEGLLYTITVLGPMVPIASQVLEQPNLNDPQSVLITALSVYLSMTNGFLFEQGILPEETQGILDETRKILEKLARIGVYFSGFLTGAGELTPPAVARLSRVIYTNSGKAVVAMLSFPIVLFSILKYGPRAWQAIDRILEKTGDTWKKLVIKYQMRDY